MILIREAERFEQAEAAGVELIDPLMVRMTNEVWLAGVVICLMNGLECEASKTVDIVHANRGPCLEARRMGIEPWEVAQFMKMKMGIAERGDE
ncbi:hypothetical protein [Nocardioides sp. WS12]|uniref:hypothetical protein n=1 Tax=Nocardioides sp. WS12 TaxID=2486272 RepID=UPI0015FE50B7|nr:hypothetical protein [Nocardioides sp. WS12]